MTEPCLISAIVTDDGLTTSWGRVPAADTPETLLLSVSVQRDDGSEVQFGAKWIRDAIDSPVVFAWDSRAVQQRNHEAADTAISRNGDEVRILFPRSWIDALVDTHELHAVAVITLDGVDREAVQFDLEVEDS